MLLWLYMRLIFILLVLANVFLLLWRYGLGLPEPYRRDAQPSVAPMAGAGQPLRLLHEPEVSADVVPPLVEEPPVLLCKMVGPFESSRAASALLERLAVLDVSAQLQPLEVSSGESFWIHFPAESNRNAARKQLARLQSQGVDSYLIPKGELEGGISLGVFSRQRSADRKVAELKALGYEPQVRIIARSSEELWVVLDAGEERKLADSTWKMLIQDTFSLQEREKPCLDVASQ